MHEPSGDGLLRGGHRRSLNPNPRVSCLELCGRPVSSALFELRCRTSEFRSESVGVPSFGIEPGSPSRLPLRLGTRFHSFFLSQDFQSRSLCFDGASKALPVESTFRACSACHRARRTVRRKAVPAVSPSLSRPRLPAYL